MKIFKRKVWHQSSYSTKQYYFRYIFREICQYHQLIHLHEIFIGWSYKNICLQEILKIVELVLHTNFN